METYYQRNRAKCLARAKEYYRENIVAFADFNRRYREENREKVKQSTKRWRENNSEKVKLYQMAWYRKNGKNRTDADYEKIYEWMESNPEKVKIQKQLQYAVMRGYIERPSCCPRCKREVRVQAHHVDYDRYTNFIWLCASCHKKEHNKRA